MVNIDGDKLNVFIVNGFPSSGKTTFEQYCVSFIGPAFCRVYSSVDFVKEVARKCGWDGTKTPENRDFLANLKDLLTNWNDIPFKKCVETVKKLEEEFDNCGLARSNGFLFIDVREPREIGRLKAELDASTILVSRPNNVPTSTNHADNEVELYEYDYYIPNDGSLENLRKIAYNFLESYIEKVGGRIWK